MAEYLVDLNATQAAIRAGYSPKTAEQQGYENLRKPQIAAAVSSGKARQLERADLSAARLLEEYRRVAFMDVRGFFDDAGNLKPVKDWTADQGAAIAQFEVIVKNAQAGDGHTDTVHKIKPVDKTRAMSDLAQHFGLLKERLDITGGLTISWLPPTS